MLFLLFNQFDSKKWKTIRRKKVITKQEEKCIRMPTIKHTHTGTKNVIIDFLNVNLNWMINKLIEMQDKKWSELLFGIFFKRKFSWKLKIFFGAVLKRHTYWGVQSFIDQISDWYLGFFVFLISTIDFEKIGQPWKSLKSSVIFWNFQPFFERLQKYSNTGCLQMMLNDQQNIFFKNLAGFWEHNN